MSSVVKQQDSGAESEPMVKKKDKAKWGDLVKEYSSNSMFDGFSEIANDNPKKLKAFWIFMISVSSVVCVGLVVRIFVDYKNQPVVQKITTERIKELPIMTICLHTKYAERVRKKEIASWEFQKLADKAKNCAIKGQCDKTDKICGGGQSTEKCGVKTVSDFLALYNRSTPEYQFINPHINLYTGSGKLDIDMEMVDYFQDGKRVLACRSFRPLSKVIPGHVRFYTRLRLSSFYRNGRNGYKPRVKIGLPGHQTTNFYYNTKRYDALGMSYRLKGNRFIENCIQSYAREEEIACGTSYVEKNLGCCICGLHTETCKKTLPCCMVQNISSDFSVKLREACPPAPSLPKCNRVLVIQESVEHDYADVSKELPKNVSELTITIVFTDPSRLIVVEERYEMSLAAAIGGVGGVLSLFIGGSILAFVHMLYFFVGNLAWAKPEKTENHTTGDAAEMPGLLENGNFPRDHVA